MIDEYYTVENPSEGFYTEKSSRFLSFIFPIKTEEEARQLIDLKTGEHVKSSHICYAYKLGPNDQLERSQDAGEPSGTAGKPILRQLNSFNVTDILGIVVRYYGGTKLGVPGLIKAYKEATRDALEKNTKKVRYITKLYEVYTDYSQIALVKHRLSRINAEIYYEDFSEAVFLRIGIRLSQTKNFESWISTLKTTRFICPDQDIN